MRANDPRRPTPSRLPFWIGTFLFMVMAIFFLWAEHRAHLLGALPWILLLACPLLHLFMHRGHSHGHPQGHGHGADPSPTDSPEERSS